MTKFVEIKSSNVSGIFEIHANKGVCWQLKDADGGLFLAQKKQVVRGPWEEDEAEEEAAAPSAPLFSQALAQVANAKPEPSKRERKSKVADPDAPARTAENTVTLKQLCFELNVIPRIARRRLRKALGNVGTGARWEWSKDSEELVKVKAALVAPVTKEEEQAAAE